MQVARDQENCVSKRRKKLRGAVQKVITPCYPSQAEKAQIDIEEADDLYREIRVDNVLTDEKGKTRALKPGEEVDIIIEADSDASLKNRSETTPF